MTQSGIQAAVLAASIIAVGSASTSAQVIDLQPANVSTVECQDGATLSGRYADVIVNGTACTLDGAIVYGSVLVDGGSLATTLDGARVYGSAQIKSGGDVGLINVDVSGALALEKSGSLNIDGDSFVSSVLVKESGDVFVGPAVSTGELLVEKSGHVAVYGSVAAISSLESGGLSLTNARVFPGGVILKYASGALEICGSEIGVNGATGLDGSGGVHVIDSGDVLAVAEGGCGASRIEGSVIVEKGAGNLRLVGATLDSDLIVTELNGTVVVDGSGCDPLAPPCATVSDVKIEKCVGDVTLRAVTTDSDTTISENDGDVTIDASELGSDVTIKLNKRVEITSSAFSLEDVRITNNEGPVLIDASCDMRLSVFENNNVMIVNNNPADAASRGTICASDVGFSDADVSTNTGGVLIENNTGEGLYCANNDPAPVAGSVGNVVSFSDGQCAGF